MSLQLDGPLLVAGAGRMGGAMLAGLIARGLAPAQIIVQDPAPPPDVAAFLARHGIAATPTVAALPTPPSVILAAVKPQVMDAVFPALARLAGPDTLTLSIAAGRTIASFAAHLPGGAAIMRAMPNTPAAIGKGITVCCANAATTPAQRALGETLLSAIGEVAFIADESQMNAVTALSGSGPAYVFHLVEAMAAAGVAAGLDAGLAQRLARSTVAGSGALLEASAEDAATLRRNVTSPGGTTAAALDVLMATPGLTDLITEAILAAKRRGEVLAQ
ncbi:MAG: pyrroline-5-carboxylate reductase [Hyphomicrobiaceae bacterium]|nr:pyrroline-5-carboxylate reductase [Hyphomicrobiaceae bacterium]